MSRCLGVFRYPARFEETAPAIRPVPFPTEKLDAAPVRVHGPPKSAVPRPFAVVRPNASNAYAAGGSATVTGSVMLPVSPRLSVTVSVTS